MLRVFIGPAYDAGMQATLEDRTAPLRAALVAVTATVIALVLPNVVAIDVSTATTLAVAALVLAAFVVVRRAGFVLQPLAVAPPTSEVPTPALPARLTDPTHHPRRPRAPGTA